MDFVHMRRPGFALAAVGLLLLGACGGGQSAAETPTQAIVETALKSNWDRLQSAPKQILTLNSVKFGAATPATAQEVQVEGIPAGMVTPAIVDFTVRTYYDSHTDAYRRVREAVVYKDKMGDWAVMTGSVKGEDTRSKEPAVK